MRGLMYLFSLAFVFLFTSCDSGGSSGGGSNISCADIAGNYSGKFTERSCDGNNYSGSVSGLVAFDCSLNFRSNYGVSISGTLTTRTQNTYSGKGQSSYCGKGSITCVDSGSAIRCEYSYDRGGGGVIY